MTFRSCKPHGSHARHRVDVWRRACRDWEDQNFSESKNLLKTGFLKIIIECSLSVFMRPTTSETCFRTTSRRFFCPTSLIHVEESSVEVKDAVGRELFRIFFGVENLRKSTSPKLYFPLCCDHLKSILIDCPLEIFPNFRSRKIFLTSQKNHLLQKLLDGFQYKKYLVKEDASALPTHVSTFKSYA